jgi:hypothetical protein
VRDATALPDWPKVFVHIAPGNSRTRIVPAADVPTFLAYKQNEPAGDGFPHQKGVPGTKYEVESDDVLIFSKVAPHIRILWQPFLLWVAPGSMVDHDLRQAQSELAKRGIAIVSQEDEVAGASHYVTNLAEPSVCLLDALTLGMSIVSCDFIEELLETSTENMEEELTGLDESVFFPIETKLDDATYQELRQSVKKNFDRTRLLRGVTLLFIADDRATTQTFETLCHIYQRTGAHLDRVDKDVTRQLTSTVKASKFLQDCLNKASKESTSEPGLKNLIIISSKRDSGSIWYPAVARASLDLKIPMPLDGLDAVAKATLSCRPARFLSELAPLQPDESFPEQDIEQEPSQRVRSSNTANESQATVPPTPSRKPKRRAGVERSDAFADVFGSLSGPAQVTASSTQQLVDESSQLTEIGPTPVSAAPKPRRDVTQSREQARRSDVWKEVANAGQRDATRAPPAESATQERYTKRFRMELDESDRLATQKTNNTQEVHDADITITAAPRKRRAEDEATDERDVDAVRTHDKNEESGKDSRSAVERTPARPEQSTKEFVKEKPGKFEKEGGRDERYLLSLATMKKNRKKMDDMDDEFNKLRIVRPNTKGKGPGSLLVDESILDDPEYRAWQEMSIDDFSIGAAGNFVQVDFVPLLRTDKVVEGFGSSKGKAVAPPTRSCNPAWQGRPNFKKFQSKNRTPRKPIEMELSKLNDYGLGSHYEGVRSKHASREVKSQQMQDDDGRTSQKQKRSIFTQSADKASQRRDGSNFGKQRQAASSSSRHGEVEVDLDLSDLNEEELFMGDDDIFDDDSVDSSSVRKTQSHQSPKKRSRGPSAQSLVVDLANSDDEDSANGTQRGGFSFKGFKRNKR